ncbi:SipW-dependent-type signal peptide-containing protein [Halobaculum sp. MBLA0147]|uniref:SipW-dependent-type signal peptide-containing protein n=1 Tax=Halobaculum sp. MBLA0147 TaxID=3079934 RepID=UPI00352539F4
MTDTNGIGRLSRRKVLAGVGAVGLASAGAGLGTSAFYSDREEFQNNEVVAGELDLLVDWQQTYTANGQTAFVNAHPDHDDDGEQSIRLPDGSVRRYTDDAGLEGPDDNGRNVDVLDCDNIPPLSEATFGTDPTTGAPQEALIDLGDVKPGDEGEVTFSLHLCDNPGYIWMQADDVSESEGLNTDSEAAVDETDGPDLASNIEVEMWYDEDCDNVRDEAEPVDIMLTLDFSGSMLYDQYGGVVSDDEITIDGTTYQETTRIDLVELGARQFVEYLDQQSPDFQVGVAYFDGEGSDDTNPRTGVLQSLTSDLSVVDAALSGLRQKLADLVTGPEPSTPGDGDGNPNPNANASNIATGTFIGEGVQDAQSELASNGRPGVRAANVTLSDGSNFSGQGPNTPVDPTDAADDARAASPAPATDLYTVSVASADEATLQAMAGQAGTAGNDPNFFFDVDDPAVLPAVFGLLAGQFVPEKVIVADTLDNVLAALSSGNGIPLDGNRATLYDEFDDAATDEDREPFVGAGIQHCLAMSWELPFEVGNEVQGDDVAFDLAFYTEQARNNDGGGPSVAV